MAQLLNELSVLRTEFSTFCKQWWKIEISLPLCISLVWSVRSTEWLLNEFDTADRNGHFNGLDVSSEGRMKSS